MILIKSGHEIELMRRSGRIVAAVLEKLRKKVNPGVKTAELDAVAEDAIRKMNAIPAFKGYQGFPASICVSINEEVVHGIPGGRRLAEGDIVSIDVGVIYGGYCGDIAATYPVGVVSEKARKLMASTKKSLEIGIANAVAGGRIGDISVSIQSFAEKSGYSVVRDFVGHGIGRQMHEEPQVPNYGEPGTGPALREGMVLAIEPMVNAGKSDVRVSEDNWTVVTADGLLSAHYEHTVAITDNGPEILTLL